MVDKALLNWIRESEKKGYSENELHQILTQRGYDDYTISNAFLEINKGDDRSLWRNKRFFTYLIMICIFIAIPISYFSAIDNAYNTDNISATVNAAGTNIDASQADENVAISCPDPQCFSQRFAECKPAKLLLKAGGIQNYYKIVGKKGNYCSVINIIVLDSIEGTKNKQINCELNYSLPFGLALQETGRCDGSIYGALT